MAIFRQKKDHSGLIASIVAGLVLCVIGFVNAFWGNDPFFGLAIVFAAGLYIWPSLSHALARFQPVWHSALKIILFLLVVWAALGVGELADKVELMRSSFPMPNITGI